jgi:hypothetical protein
MIGSGSCASGLPDMCEVELFEIVIGMPFQFCSVAKLWGCVMPWDMSAKWPMAARSKTRPNWPEQASGAASGQGSCVGRNPPLYGPRGGC